MRWNARDGSGRYRYDFTINNPGRLPISEVKVDLKFPLRVHRTHADGSVGTYLGSDELRMEVAAVAAGGKYTWDRHLLVPESIGKKMRQTTASILFYSTDAGWCRTTWPCPAGSKSDRLIARLPKDLRVSDIDSLDNP